MAKIWRPDDYDQLNDDGFQGICSRQIFFQHHLISVYLGTIDPNVYISFNCLTVESPGKSKPQRYHVTQQEQRLVSRAYQACTSWEEMFAYVKARVREMPGNNKTQEYYGTASTKSAIQRMKRIINLERKQGHEKPKQSTSMAADRDMRYASKSTPEERRQRKFNSAVLISSESEEEASSLKPACAEQDPEEMTKSPPLKRKRKREAPGKKAYEAHTQMCDRAVKLMSRVQKMIDDMSSDSDD